MMKIVVKTGLLCAMLLLFVNMATAQKFGYVNSAAILNEMPEMKQMKSALEAFQTILKKDGEAKVAAYQQEEQSAVQKKQRGEMTPKEEEEVMKKLQKMQEELYAYSQEVDEKMAKKQEDEMKPILTKVNEAIQAVAKEGQFQFVFDAQSGVILYADESTDVTGLVKAKLGIQ
jgi:outer membrane protein